MGVGTVGAVGTGCSRPWSSARSHQGPGRDDGRRLARRRLAGHL